MFRGENLHQMIPPSCFPIIIMNSFSALNEYDLKIRLHRRDLHRTAAFCGHFFTMKLQLKKWHLHTWQKTNLVTSCTSSLTLSYGSSLLYGGVYARCKRFSVQTLLLPEFGSYCNIQNTLPNAFGNWLRTHLSIRYIYHVEHFISMW